MVFDGANRAVPAQGDVAVALAFCQVAQQAAFTRGQAQRVGPGGLVQAAQAGVLAQAAQPRARHGGGRLGAELLEQAQGTAQLRLVATQQADRFFVGVLDRTPGRRGGVEIAGQLGPAGCGQRQLGALLQLAQAPQPDRQLAAAPGLADAQCLRPGLVHQRQQGLGLVEQPGRFGAGNGHRCKPG